LLSSGFGIVEAFPAESDASGFSKKLLLAVVERANQRDCSVVVSQAVFRGLGMLLTSRSLSPQLTEQVEEFSLRKLQHPTHSSNSIRSFLALGLLLSCMYNGGGSAPDKPLDSAVFDDSGSMANMSRMERVQTLFANMRKGMFSQHAGPLTDIMARLIVDVFKADQALSFILGEFAKHRSSQEMVAQVLFKVFQLIGPGRLVCNWVSVCIPSFLQRQTKAIWTTTCVFLAASPSPLLRGLFADVSASARDDNDLFLLAAAEFLAIREMDARSRSDVVLAMSRVPGPPFATVVSLASKIFQAQEALKAKEDAEDSSTH
jgi:hypothetical protein